MSAERCEQLMDEGYGALDAEDFERALKAGEELRSLRHSSCFEIMGRAYWEMGRREEAFAALEEGVRVAPGVYILWEYLGCYYSDQGRYADARAALERGLECPGAIASAVLYNLALVYEREGRLREAWETLGRIVTPESYVSRAALASFQARVLNRLGRHDEAFAVADGAITGPGEPPAGVRESGWDAPQQPRAALFSERGFARWRSGRDRAKAWADAMAAIELYPRDAGAMWLVRELEGMTSAASRQLRVTVRGRWHEPIEGEDRPPAFFQAYSVIADDAEEAMTFIRRFERPEVRHTLTLHESSVIGDRPDQPKGVYGVETGRVFFPAEGGE